jgi:phage protein D
LNLVSEFEIKAGFDNEKNTIFKGIITKIGIKVNSKTSMLIVECHDKATKLTIDRNTKIYNDKKDSDIFSALAGDAGFR